MNVIVVLEHHFAQTPDGSVWTQTTFPYPFWTRYLMAFDAVRVIARVRDVPCVASDWKRADGDRVSFVPVPDYLGPWQYLLKARQVTHTVKHAVSMSDAVILRSASPISYSVERFLEQSGHPYAVEVVADPYDVFSPGAVRHPLRPFFRWFFFYRLQRQCARACAAAYVTQFALQQRYPPAKTAFSTHYSSHYSSGELSDSIFVAQPRLYQPGSKPLTLITVGTLAQLYKAQDILIDAFIACVRRGLNLKLVLVGNGRYQAELEARVAASGLSDRVLFTGQLASGEAIYTQLDQADLFVLPSRQEGLPRAMIEAMARALPCIGSTVGGIPELLPPENLVPPGDADALARKIQEVATDPDRMTRMSAQNLEKAKEYQDDILRERRNKFYRYVREKTEDWLRQNP